MKIIRIAALAITLGFLSLSAQAMSIQWNLSGVTFGDGGTASGSFFFDADTITYSGISITTTVGTFISTPGVFTDHEPSFGVAPDFLTVKSGPAIDLTGLDILHMTFAAGLTSVGGTVGILVTLLSQEADICLDPGCGTASGTRQITGGSVIAATAMPEPGTLGLALIGLAGLGFSRKRKQRQSAAV
jgi:hypothetical protein